MHRNCEECTRLWNEYALATRHYLKLEGRVQVAGASRDRRTVQELRPRMESAAAERERLRKLIDEHESMPQEDFPTALSQGPHRG